jgi:hypothetical protein
MPNDRTPKRGLYEQKDEELTIEPCRGIVVTALDTLFAAAAEATVFWRKEV